MLHLIDVTVFVILNVSSYAEYLGHILMEKSLQVFDSACFMTSVFLFVLNWYGTIL
jgi:hypothetical protein